MSGTVELESRDATTAQHCIDIYLQLEQGFIGPCWAGLAFHFVETTHFLFIFAT